MITEVWNCKIQIDQMIVMAKDVFNKTVDSCAAECIWEWEEVDDTVCVCNVLVNGGETCSR